MATPVVSDSAKRQPLGPPSGGDSSSQAIISITNDYTETDQSISSRQPMKESSSSSPGGKTTGAGFALFLGGAAAVTYLGVSSGLSVAFIAGGASFGGVAILLLIAMAAAKHAKNTQGQSPKALQAVGMFGIGFYAIPFCVMVALSSDKTDDSKPPGLADEGTGVKRKNVDQDDPTEELEELPS